MLILFVSLCYFFFFQIKSQEYVEKNHQRELKHLKCTISELKKDICEIEENQYIWDGESFFIVKGQLDQLDQLDQNQ